MLDLLRRELLTHFMNSCHISNNVNVRLVLDYSDLIIIYSNHEFGGTFINVTCFIMIEIAQLYSPA